MLVGIVAMTKDRVIGKDNKLLWHLPEDLQFFKEKTSGHVIIMGRRTFESLPRILPQREHWVLTENRDFSVDDERVKVFHSIDEIILAAKNLDLAFVIGGGKLYHAMLKYLDLIYVTEVDAKLSGDTYFPEIKSTEFREVESSEWRISAKDNWKYRYLTYKSIIDEGE